MHDDDFIERDCITIQHFNLGRFCNLSIFNSDVVEADWFDNYGTTGKYTYSSLGLFIFSDPVRLRPLDNSIASIGLL